MTQLKDLDFSLRYSYADYLTWRFEERVELFKGKIFPILQTPNTIHQYTSGNLIGELYINYKNKSCKIYNAPFDVRLLDNQTSIEHKNIYSVVQPDICIIKDLSKLDELGCIGSPDLIIEIVSSSTAEKDTIIKYQLYEENEIPEYWLVFPYEKTISVFDLNSQTKKYKLRGMYGKNSVVKVASLNDFEIKLTEIFTGELDYLYQ